MSRFIFYRNTEEVRLAEDFMELASGAEGKMGFEELFAKLMDIASFAGFKGNLWHRLLTEALVYDENPYTKVCELRHIEESSIKKAALEDIRIFYELFNLNIHSTFGKAIPEAFLDIMENYDKGLVKGEKYNRIIRQKVNELTIKLAGAPSPEEMQGILEEFYAGYGIGKFGLHKAFRVDARDSAGVNVDIYPIYNIAVTSLDDLVGCEEQKKLLRDNTEAFIEGRKANNCLLYGDAGTGKSSSIRSILNEYYDRGLRMIEVYKHQYREINSLIDTLKNRNYHFIIYMDDLSFEEFEVEYKYLKAVLEGGLESRPDNVLIYATSNRRHLVRENFTDREEGANDKHSAETVQEKLSLYERFGLSIYFGSPAQDEYYEIVDALAERYGIEMDKKELHIKASRWALSRSGFSGRGASQFIDHLRGGSDV